MGCGLHYCAKILLMVMTTIYGLFGAAILGFGIWILVDDNVAAYFDIVDAAVDSQLAQYIAVVSITIGGILLLVCLAGCCGACLNNKCLLITYSIFMACIILMHIAAGVLAILMLEKLGDELEEGLNDFLIHDYDGGESDESYAWNVVQVHMECCGVSGKEDYYNETLQQYEPPAPGWVWPYQCCVLNDKDDIREPDMKDEDLCRVGQRDYVHNKGCYEKIENWFDKYGEGIAGLMFVIAFLQLMTICMACCLMKHNKEKGDYA